MIAFPAGVKVWIAGGVTDMRRGMNTLALQVQEGLGREPPCLRFSRDEAHRLKPIDGLPAFLTSRDLVHRVSSDCAVEVDGNAYSVPWRLIGERVSVAVTGTELRVSHAGREVACHRLRFGRRARIVDRTHFEGITGSPLARAEGQAEPAPLSPELLRPLSEYEAVAGGAW